MVNYNKIKNFTDLIVWQYAHQLTLAIYEVTKSFPKGEMYSLVDQMRRCSISVTSNIAEGFSRSTRNDKLHFYFMSKGSMTELQNQLILAKDLGYIAQELFDSLYERTIVILKLLNKFISVTENRIIQEQERGI